MSKKNKKKKKHRSSDVPGAERPRLTLKRYEKGQPGSPCGTGALRLAAWSGGRGGGVAGGFDFRTEAVSRRLVREGIKLRQALRTMPGRDTIVAESMRSPKEGYERDADGRQKERG